MADVGTDHGYLPVWLLQHGRIVSAIATDIRPGPLSRAAACAETHEIRGMRCILCDGLSMVSPAEVNTVVIAGMGGENIADILQRAPWTKTGTTLILQPMSRGETLRADLRKLGLCIEGECLVEDAGRIYSILVAQGGNPRVYTDAELYTGRYEQVREEPLFPRLLGELQTRFARETEGLSRSVKPEDHLRVEKARRITKELEAMEEKYYANGI